MARPQDTDLATSRVIAELRQHELLLQAGREFASVANIVAGETISGSWWAHPQSNLIYWVCQDLEQHPSVAEARLLAGKVTQLWQTIWGRTWRPLRWQSRTMADRTDFQPPHVGC